MAKIKIPTVNEKLLEKYIRHSVYLEQLKKAEASLISRFLKQKTFPQIYNKLIKELSRIKNLETLGSINRIPVRRLKVMLAATQKISTAGMVQAEKMLVNRLVNISKFEADWNADLISKTVPLDIDMSMPSNEVLKNLVTMRPMDGHKLGTWMKGYSTAVRVAMTKQIKVGIATGESLPKIGKRIEKALGYKTKQAEYIARTAVSNVVHQAREEVYKKNSDLVRKVQWVSTLDDRTSMECIHLDGKVFDVGDGPRPPIHFNCRSSTIPITPSWQEYGIEEPPPATRASMDGGVPAKTTYGQWIKNQPKAVQDKVLGKTRAELYRSGQVKIDRFVGRDLKPLTLKELAKREGISLKPPEVLPAPPQVKAMPTKGTGAKLTDADKKYLDAWSQNKPEYADITRVQRGLNPRHKVLKGEDFVLVKKSDVLMAEKNLTKSLKKLDGFNGTTHRGMIFETATERAKYLKEFKHGQVWKSKTFLASSKESQIIVGKDVKNNLIFQIRGRSGRDITNYSRFPSEKEVLFMKGTSFKVDKIVGNRVYLSEVTKQAQLKVAPAPPTTVTKVGTTFAETTTKDIRKFVNDTIDSYPEKVKVALNNRGINYNIGNSLTEIDPRLKGVHPAGWSKGSTWDNVSGMYNIENKTVSVAETYRPIGKKLYEVNSKNQIRAILNHETGHGFDASPEGLFYSSRPEFKAAYAKDIAKLSKVDIVKNDLRFFMQKGVRGRSETFAEMFGDIMGGGARSGIGQFFPNCKKYVEDILK